MVRELPKVNLGGQMYFIDERLGQIRHVDNPHDFKEFADMCEEELDAVEIALSTPEIPAPMSSRTDHTPGPWKAAQARKHEWFVSSAVVDLARMLHNGQPHPKGKRGMNQAMAANAKLIAAAPDLLDCLAAAVARVELANKEGDSILSAWLPDAKRAIARAKGE